MLVWTVFDTEDVPVVFREISGGGHSGGGGGGTGGGGGGGGGGVAQETPDNSWVFDSEVVIWLLPSCGKGDGGILDGKMGLESVLSLDWLVFDVTLVLGIFLGFIVNGTGCFFWKTYFNIQGQHNLRWSSG